MQWFNASKLKELVTFGAPQEFLDANGFTRASFYCREKNIAKILASGTFASYGFTSEQEDIPYLDHAVLYKSLNPKVCCLGYTPYQHADYIEDTVKAWAKSRGLEAEVFPTSWYNDTCLVLIHTPNCSISVPDKYKGIV